MSTAVARSDQVYATLREEIVDGAHSPGTTLVQEQLADRFAVSRTPVREALTRLAQEGLVDAVTGRGFVVRGLADDDIRAVQEVRESLELLALEKSCGTFDPAQVARVTALVEELAAADPADTHRIFELNRDFHLAMAQGCGNPVLLELLRQLWDRPVNRRITAGYLKDPQHLPQMVQEHRDLLAAAADGDTARLLTLAKEHMAAGYADVPADG